MYTYTHPPCCPISPSRLSQSTELGSLYIQQVPNGYFTRGSAHVSNPVSQFIPSLLTPLLTLSLQHVHTSILSIWVSIPALLKHFLQSPGAIQKCFISVIKIFSSKSFRFFFFLVSMSPMSLPIYSLIKTVFSCYSLKHIYSSFFVFVYKVQLSDL